MQPGCLLGPKNHRQLGHMKHCLFGHANGHAKPLAADAKARNCSPHSLARQVVDVYEPVEDGSRDKAYISKV